MVHAVHYMFQFMDCEAVLVDASKAFNSLNRQVALPNPSIATILINCYRSDIPLYINGETLVSAEGTTLGDPLAIALYALGVLPHIWHSNQFTGHQVWYADDAAALGDLQCLKLWCDQLLCHVSPPWAILPILPSHATTQS